MHTGRGRQSFCCLRRHQIIITPEFFDHASKPHAPGAQRFRRLIRTRPPHQSCAAPRTASARKQCPSPPRSAQPNPVQFVEARQRGARAARQVVAGAKRARHEEGRVLFCSGRRHRTQGSIIHLTRTLGELGIVAYLSLTALHRFSKYYTVVTPQAWPSSGQVALLRECVERVSGAL